MIIEEFVEKNFFVLLLKSNEIFSSADGVFLSAFMEVGKLLSDYYCTGME